MATVMRKMNIISRCEGIYRTKELGGQFPAVYHSYILAICRHPGMSQETLAKHLCINKSSVTRHVAALEKDGFVKRCVSEEDKREMLVYPTDKMLEIHPEVVEITKRWNLMVAEGISESEMELFHKILDKMLQKSTEIIYRGDESK